MIALLDTLDAWIDEIPPLPTPQRYGNLAFRTWGKRLESVRVSLLSRMTYNASDMSVGRRHRSR